MLKNKISSKYCPDEIESKWYKAWLKENIFHSEVNDKEPYTVIMPPPNVTGVLHMGHILNNTIQDVLVRKERMCGKNACWVPGIDHASIATEAKVVQWLKEKGIDKWEISREEFIKYAWQWTEKHGGIILEQLKKLGCSCDWQRKKFTLDKEQYESVIQCFIDLYKKGYIYKGKRMINWDPVAKTALSDEEVIYKEVKSKLFYVKYKIKDYKNSYITIATTRPETIMADTAIAVNPNDNRYKHFIGKFAIVPEILGIDREIPIIADDYVDIEFGTGALKITPAHDPNDYEIALKHNLDFIDIFNEDATLNDKGGKFSGLDRFKAREKVVEVLKRNNYLIKTEEIINNIGFSERTDVVVEPKISLQWFCKTKKLAKPALENVINDNIKFYPAKFKNTYRHWMENIKDWCISRQLWWGHRIPAYYCAYKGCENVIMVQNNKPDKCFKCKRSDKIYQDEDVLDTWFSSWLWPISVFNGILKPNNEDINYYYPSNDLVTAPEIMFFWVARMIMAGYEFRQNKPFSNVYYTGIVRDKQRRKMSKSLGNSPDPIELINKYGADGVRVGMLFSSPAGNDLLFDESLCLQGRNFCNKIWNAFRLINNWEISNSKVQQNEEKIAIEWMQARINESIIEIEKLYSKFKISEVLMLLYKLTWDDFCSWYLELIKNKDKKINELSYSKTVEFFNILLKLLHPFIPFITEEIWQNLPLKKESKFLANSSMPIANKKKLNKKIINDFKIAQNIVSAIRTFRKENDLKNSITLNLSVKKNNKYFPNNIKCVIEKLTNSVFTENIDNKFSIISDIFELSVKFDNIQTVKVDLKKIEKELQALNNFLNKINSKLNNKKFIENAPKNVIELEKKKKNDTEKKIALLKNKIDKILRDEE